MLIVNGIVMRTDNVLKPADKAFLNLPKNFVFVAV